MPCYALPLLYTTSKALPTTYQKTKTILRDFKNVQNTAIKLPEPFLRETPQTKNEELNYQNTANLEVGWGALGVIKT